MPDNGGSICDEPLCGHLAHPCAVMCSLCRTQIPSRNHRVRRAQWVGTYFVPFLPSSCACSPARSGFPWLPPPTMVLTLWCNTRDTAARFACRQRADELTQTLCLGRQCAATLCREEEVEINTWAIACSSFAAILSVGAPKRLLLLLCIEGLLKKLQ